MSECCVKFEFIHMAILQSPVQMFRGENLDFPLCTIPTVSCCEKYGVFENNVLLVGWYCRNSSKGKI